jgi:plasmid stabilization system protein ParE
VAVKKIEFHHEAAAEYDASFDWYLEQSPDAARRFDVEVEHAISQIRKVPLAGATGPSIHADICCVDFRFSWFIENAPSMKFRS